MCCKSLLLFTFEWQRNIATIKSGWPSQIMSDARDSKGAEWKAGNSYTVQIK